MDVWIGRNGERLGPYSEEQIREWLRDGSLKPDELGWYEGLADWQPMRVLFVGEVPRVADMPPLPPSTAPYAELQRAADVSATRYSSFWIRVGAFLLDYIILLVPFTVLAQVMGVLTAAQEVVLKISAGGDMLQAADAYGEVARPWTMLTIALGFIYYAAFEASAWQATPGKRICGIHVTDVQGARLTPLRSVGRNAVRLTNIVMPLIPFISYMAVAWTAKKQGLHDLLAGTLVVTGKPGTLVLPERRDDGAFDA
jgi:uncharacterized RDD family membrane protein YckC